MIALIYPTDPKAGRKNCKIKMIINSIFSLDLGANHEENFGNGTRKTAPFRITASLQLKMATAANRNDSLFVAFQPMGIFRFCRNGRIDLFFFPKTFAVPLYISVPVPTISEPTPKVRSVFRNFEK